MLRRKTQAKSVVGIHIGGQSVNLAILATDEQGHRSLTLDSVEVFSGVEQLESVEAAFRELNGRHGLRRWPLTVVLDGDYCVTRVATGTPQEVEENLQRLATRVPRYLSLGPGEKITGGYRYTINNKSEYAVNGVANRRVIEALQHSMRTCGLSPASIEPSMVAVARAMESMSNVPDLVLLADGSGTQWDVGIVQAGRLLLDYRPSAARESDRFGEILCGHMSRLHRFCQRHRHLGNNELRNIYVYGPAEKAITTARTIQAKSGMDVHVLTAEQLIPGCNFPDDVNDGCWVGAVAAAMTMELVTDKLQVADLLSSVRTVGQKSLSHHLFWTVAPVLAASIILCAMYWTVEGQRSIKPSLVRHSETIGEELSKLRAAAKDAVSCQTKLNVFQAIAAKIRQHEFSTLLINQIPQSLPDATKLKRVQLSIDGTIRISGTALNEAIVFDVMSGLRRLPDVADVQLEGTTPNGEIGNTEVDFALVIKMTPLSPKDQV